MNRPALALAVVVASSLFANAAHAAPPQPKPVHIHLELSPRMIEQAAAFLQAALPAATPPPPPPVAVPPPASQETTPSNSGKPGLVDLPVPGYGNAVVSAPASTTPKPVMVVAHGRHGAPEGSCEHWRNQFGERGFILCPRGTPMERPGQFTHGKELPDEIDAGLVALKTRFGALVDPGPMIYIGYSQGAGLAYSVVMKSPSRFSRAIIIEGGSGGWNEKTFAQQGGQRMLFACGQAACANAAKPVVARFEKAKVPAKMRYAPGAGHVETGPVAEMVKEEWNWLVAGDPRWAPLNVARKPPPRPSGGSSV